MKYFVILMVLAPLTLAQDDTLFVDDFDDGNAEGWFELDGDGTYTVNASLRYDFFYDGSSDDSWCLSYRGDNGSSMSVENYSVLFETVSPDPMGHRTGIDIRFNPADSTSYSLYLGYDVGKYRIGRFDSFYIWTQLGPSIPYDGGFVYGIPYWVRFECSIDTLRAKIWEGGAGAEPTDWMIVRIDGTYINNGCVALESVDSLGGPHYHSEFDNVVVTAVDTLALENTTWGAIKSAF